MILLHYYRQDYCFVLQNFVNLFLYVFKRKCDIEFGSKREYNHLDTVE